MAAKKKKSKPMSAKLKAFLKAKGRFPKTSAEKKAAGIAPKKSKSKSKSRSKSRSKPKKGNPTGGNRTVKRGIYIAVLMGFLIPPLMVIIDGWQRGVPMATTLARLGQLYTGLDLETGTFDPMPPILNYGSIGIGITASKFLGSWMGVNRRLPAGINL